MVKFQSFPLILASFLTIAIPSALTAPSYAIAMANKWAMCNQTSPSMLALAVVQSDYAISVVKGLATLYLKDELDKEFNDEMERIHTFKTDWNVVKDVPKLPGKPTCPQVLDAMNDKDALEKVYKYLDAVRRGIKERKKEATKYGILRHKEMFTDLLSALDKVIEDFKKILPMFNASMTKIQPVPPTPKSATDLSEHHLRNIIIIHDYLIVVEFTNDVARRLLKTHCGAPV